MSELDMGSIAEVKFLNLDDLMNFTVGIKPESEYWKGAQYVFMFQIPPNYPYSPPKVTCETPINHSVIHSKVHLCLSILREEWNPVLDINAVLCVLLNMFYEPNPSDTWSHVASLDSVQNMEQSTGDTTAYNINEGEERNDFENDGSTSFAHLVDNIGFLTDAHDEFLNRVKSDRTISFANSASDENYDFSHLDPEGFPSIPTIGWSDSIRDRGTGYAGTEEDNRVVMECAKEAEKRNQQHDMQTVAYLKNTTKELKKYRDCSDTIFHHFICSRQDQLQKTLKEVFWSSSLKDLENRRHVLIAALELCHLLMTDARLDSSFFLAPSCQPGNSNFSVISSIDRLAEQSRLISSCAEKLDSDDTEILHLLLQVQSEARQALSWAANQPNNLSPSHLGLASQPKSPAVPSPLVTSSNQCHHLLEEEYKQRLGSLKISFVDDLPNHAFEAESAFNCNKKNSRLYKELISYEGSLPLEYGSSIFLRVKSSQINMIRALVIGAEETPYANGCFIFDIMLPYDYPSVCPKVRFRTTGDGKMRCNPNLYSDGRVCLSLLGTWRGPGWIEQHSTLLQVLISIQSMIFVPDPFFNEPCFDALRGTAEGNKMCDEYNIHTRYYTWKYAILDPLQKATWYCSSFSNSNAVNIARGSKYFSTYPEFMDVIIEHFRCKAQVIQNQIKSWLSERKSEVNSHVNQVTILLKELESVSTTSKQLQVVTTCPQVKN
jgi:ubiquitin-protein ligase